MNYHLKIQPTISHHRINPTNYLAWGNLVKTWATGRNYVDQKPTAEALIPLVQQDPIKYPKPTSFEDFVEQCIAAGVGLVYEDGQSTQVRPEDGRGFLLVQATPGTMVLRLPAAEMLHASEAALLGGERYPIPDFYDVLYEEPSRKDDLNSAEKIRLHAERVGEYTVNVCH